MISPKYSDSIFINCPFDDEYTPLLRSIVFTVYRCGFLPVTALAEDNGLENRLTKIEKCIDNCKYGIHDISRTELNINHLPRFNMAFELGIFFGAKKYGSKEHKAKNALIFDTEKYRYQEFISDLNGVDIKAHGNEPNIIIRKIRDWLSTSSRRTSLPSTLILQRDFLIFQNNLPAIAERLQLDINDIPFNDYCLIGEEAIKTMGV